MSKPRWTVVQHSAFGYKDNGQFEQGLETRRVDPIGQRKVQRAGGVLFDSYKDAEDYADDQMYQPEVQGLIPEAPGTFANAVIDGLAIYLPAREADTTETP